MNDLNVKYRNIVKATRSFFGNGGIKLVNAKRNIGYSQNKLYF